MAAPLLIGLLSLITGVGAGTYALPALTGAAKAEAAISVIYAKIPEICAATGPLVVALQTKFPKAKELYKLRMAGAAICVAADRPDNPINQARALADALIAIRAAEQKLDSKKVPPK